MADLAWPPLNGACGAPWVIFAPEGSAEVRHRLTALEAKGCQIHRFDAHDLLTEQAVYRSFAETLRFPGYFGWNCHAMVDCLDDLCGAVTGGGAGIVGVIRGVDERLVEAEHFPLFVSVLCQGADRANSAVDLDGSPLDRPAIAEHFLFEFSFESSALDPGVLELEKAARRVEEDPDLVVTRGEGFVGVALDPDVWH
ncbi:barstar family protein [Actinomycetota bacterium Odt1-20B]